MKKISFALTFFLSVFLVLSQKSISTAEDISCEDPEVPYEGECTDPYPPCLNAPINSVLSTCVDKIENGVRIGRYSFECQDGYHQVEKECLAGSSEPPEEGEELPPAGYEDEVITSFEGYANPFPDTNLTDLEGQAAGELQRRGVIGGFPDGEFKGDHLVNRAEAAKFLLLARYESIEPLENNGVFSDVLDGEWYTPFVMQAFAKGIINGYPDQTFRPADTIKTVEFLKMLAITFDLELDLEYSYQDVPDGEWYVTYVGSAQKYDLFPNRSDFLMPEKELSRAEVAVAIYQYLKNRE